jgi:hypothetical protein
MTAGSDALEFREECLLLKLKCDLLVGGQDHAHSFRNARNRKDAVQLLQRFVHWEVSFGGGNLFYRRFGVLALKVRGLGHKSKPYLFSPG